MLQYQNRAVRGPGNRIEYTYNIKNWITNITHENPNTQENYFYTNLYYDTGLTPQYSGNISSIEWKSIYVESQQRYDFEYDGINRLIKADHTPDDKFSTTYNYDYMGNLKQLTRRGGRNGSYGLIDDLRYDYYPNSNKLGRVRNHADNQTPDIPFNPDIKPLGFDNRGLTFEEGEVYDDYQYDNNGNMVLDQRLNRTIKYNFLNLPSEIVMLPGVNSSQPQAEQMIQYTYTASGRKLSQQLVEDGRVGKHTSYLGAFVFTGDKLAWVNTPHGRVSIPKLAFSTPRFEFHLKDHLGNTRVALSTRETDNVFSITQDVSYYPFGMTIDDLSYMGDIMDGSTANRYLYNGKELQDDFGLDWYDYGARFYDAQIGRWHTLDPLATNYFAISPYAYVANNPIIYIDPDGKKIVIAHGPNTAEYLKAEKLLIVYKAAFPKTYYALDSNPNIIITVGYQDRITTESGKPLDGKCEVDFITQQIASVNSETDSSGQLIGGNFTTYEVSHDLVRTEKIVSPSKVPAELIKISHIGIFLSSNLNDIKKQFEILSHEFGHAEFSINNIGLACLWFLIDPTDDKHHINNPNGKAANSAETKAISIPKSAINEMFFWHQLAKKEREIYNAWLKGGAGAR